MAYFYSNLQPGATAPGYAQPLPGDFGRPRRISAAATGTKPVAPMPDYGASTRATGDAIANAQRVAGQLPGYQDILSNIGNTLKSESAGQLPTDVVTQLSQLGAERGVATGSPGSPNSSATLLRSLGLTSLDLTGRAQQGFQGILPTLPGYNIANNPNFYVTPQQSYEAALQAAVFNAAPDPAAAANASLDAVRGGFGAGGGFGGGGGGPALFGGGSTYTGGNLPMSAGTDPATAGTFYSGTWYPPGVTPTNMQTASDLASKYAQGLPEDISTEQSDYYSSPDYAATLGAE